MNDLVIAKKLVIVSAAIEAATGMALVAVPDLVAAILLGVALPGSGIAVARLTGIALLCLAVACWPRGESATASAIAALFLYNLFAAIYLAYLRVGGGYVGYLLWPACALHALLALLLVRSAYASVSGSKPVGAEGQ